MGGTFDWCVTIIDFPPFFLTFNGVFSVS